MNKTDIGIVGKSMARKIDVIRHVATCLYNEFMSDGFGERTALKLTKATLGHVIAKSKGIPVNWEPD